MSPAGQCFEMKGEGQSPLHYSLVFAQHCNHFKVCFIDEHAAPSISHYLLTDWHWQMTTAVLPWVASWRHARTEPYAEGRGRICGPSEKSSGEERDRCFCGWFCKPRGINLCCCQQSRELQSNVSSPVLYCNFLNTWYEIQYHGLGNLIFGFMLYFICFWTKKIKILILNLKIISAFNETFLCVSLRLVIPLWLYGPQKKNYQHEF